MRARRENTSPAFSDVSGLPLGSVGRLARHQATITAVLIVLVGMVACDRAPSPSAITTDSAGVQIIESVRPAWGDTPAWSIDSVPTLTIGTETGEDPYQLFRARSARRLSDGSIVIANEGSGELRFFDDDGTYRHSAGRFGGGPGEFSQFSSMYLWVDRDGHLAVSDGFNDRVNVFSESGRYESLVRFTAPAETPGSSMEGVFSDGSWLGRGVVGGGMLTPTPGVTPPMTFVLQRYGPTGDHLADLARVNSRRRFTHQFAGTTTFPYIPFEQEVLFAVQNDGLVVMSGDRTGLTHYDGNGRVDRLMRWDSDGRTRTSEIYSRYLDEVVAQMEDEQRRQRWLNFYGQDLPIPAFVPIASGLFVDSAGAIWVRRFRLPWETEPRWDILSAQGEWLGSLSMPEGLTVFEIGEDYILGSHRDDLGVERVQLFTLRR